MKEEEVQTEELTLFPWRVTTAQVSHIYFVSADRIEKYKLTPTITITFFFFFYRRTFSKDLHSGSSTRREKTERRSSTVDRKMSGTVFQFHHTSHSVTTPTCLLSVSWTHCCHGDGWCHPTAGGGSGVMLRPDRRALIQKTELILFLFFLFFFKQRPEHQPGSLQRRPFQWRPETTACITGPSTARCGEWAILQNLNSKLKLSAK